jgi:glutamate--cysteine ligase
MEQVLERENLITDKKQLTKFFASGCKSKKDFKIGLEFEKIAVNSYNFKSVPYSGKNGLRDFLFKYKSFDRMDEIFIDDSLLGLNIDSGYISLEPGCQTELSTIPFEKVSDIASIIEEWNLKSAFLGEELGIYWLGCGIQPLSTFENIEMIPKKRYAIMSNYLPSKGSRSLVMMSETAGLQTIVDYESEEDAMLKLKVAMSISPVITAMFANSPIRGGKETGYKSYRASSWLDMDNDRCGFISKKIFNDDFSFADYAEFLLDVPMFFIEREKNIINATHLTFREYMSNGYDGHSASPEDWHTHITTVFPEVRLKNFLEIRNCDSQKADMILALPALIKGIIYNTDALAQSWELMKQFTYEQLEEMRHEVPKYALQTEINGIKVANLAKELVNIAEKSLLSDVDTAKDAVYLSKLKELVEQELSPADIILQNWNGSWNKNIEKFIEYSKLN